jgi:hypothetical protein
MTEPAKLKLRDITLEEFHKEITDRLEYSKKEFYPIGHCQDEKQMLENIYRLRGAMFAFKSLLSFLECNSPPVKDWPKPDMAEYL